MKKLIAGAVGAAAVFALFAAPAASLAAYFNAGKAVDVGGTQAIAQNAYVAGGAATVTAPVQGDLLLAGGNVFVSSEVSQDIMAVGGTVILSGASAQDIRIAGGNVTIGSTASGELLAAGGQITVTPDSKLAKDSYLAGGSVMFNGDEAGNLQVYGGSVVIAGTVGKDLTIKASKDVTIASGAVIKGNLDYTAPAPATIGNGAQIMGQTTFHAMPAAAAARASGAGWFGPLAAFLAFWLVMKFLMVLLLAYVLWYAFRKDATDMLAMAGSHFWGELLRGFVFLVAMPVAIIIALVTVVGAMAGVIAGLAYAALIALAFPVEVLVASSLILKCRVDLRWYHILLGAVVLAIAVVIPFIGWLACFMVYLASFGVLLHVIGRKFACDGR